MGGYLPTAAWANGVTNTAPNAGQFSILQLTSYFSQGGEWEFLLDWDDRATSVKWTQSEDPFVGRGTVSNIVQSPPNQTGCVGDDFAGLAADGDGAGASSSVLDGSANTCWWWAVGTSGSWAGAIPAYKDSDAGRLDATRARLWVR
jgi:hypothetical protein